jgi:hypothetical protein
MGVISSKLWAGEHRSAIEAKVGTSTIYYSVQVAPGDLPHVAETGVPYAIGSSLQNDPRGRKCVGINPVLENGSNNLYRVGVDFSDNGNADTFVTNPLDRLFRPELDFEESREPLYEDGNGNPIVNAAGQAFDPPIDTPVRDAVVILRWNTSTYLAALAKSAIGSVNTDVVFGAQPGELKITGWQITPLEENSVKYYQNIVKITERENRVVGGQTISGWAKLVLNEGRYCNLLAGTNITFDGTAALVTPILDSAGEPVSDPVKLNGDGSILNSKAGATSNDPLFIVSTDGKSVFRHVPPHKLRAFSSFGFRYEI